MNGMEQALDVNDNAYALYSIVLAESSTKLREKLAEILNRYDSVSCVITVDDDCELVELVRIHKPDFVFACISMLKDRRVTESIRKACASCQILALAECISEPYVRMIHSLGIDGIVEKSRVGDYVCYRSRTRDSWTPIEAE